MTIEITMALINRLQEAFPSHYVDEYLEQYDDTENNPLYASNSWFVEFLPILWENLGNEVQSGTLDFVIHHVTETGYDDNRRTIAPSSQHHGIDNNKLQEFLHKWSCNVSYIGVVGRIDPLINTISRVSSEKSTRMRSLMVSKHRFSATIYDYSANKVYIPILADLYVKIYIANNINDTDSVDSIEILTDNHG